MRALVSAHCFWPVLFPQAPHRKLLWAPHSSLISLLLRVLEGTRSQSAPGQGRETQPWRWAPPGYSSHSRVFSVTFTSVFPPCSLHPCWSCCWVLPSPVRIFPPQRIFPDLLLPAFQMPCIIPSCISCHFFPTVAHCLVCVRH